MTLLPSGRSALALSLFGAIACGVSLDAVTPGADATGDAGAGDAGVQVDAGTPQVDCKPDDTWLARDTAVCNGDCTPGADGSWQLTARSADTTAGALWIPMSELLAGATGSVVVEVDLEIEADDQARKAGDGFALSWLSPDDQASTRPPEPSRSYGGLGLSLLQDFRGQAAFVRTRGAVHQEAAGSLQLGTTAVPSPDTRDRTVEGWEAAAPVDRPHFRPESGLRLRLTAELGAEGARVSTARDDDGDVQSATLRFTASPRWFGISASTCEFGQSAQRIRAIRRCVAR